MNDYVEKCLVSACLTGLSTRYDGKSKKNHSCMHCLQKTLWIPVCPEQLGGLPTPRPAASIIGGNGFDVLKGKAHVLDCNNNDVTSNFIQGAELVLSIAQSQKITTCYLKSRSPSCAINGNAGVTAALLIQQGIHVLEFD
ncbi:DUF523 domain-containing protein [Desulfogranum marinum]|uniref:DUF523 domain-containing protein n=1 Tax=Desulfogranum marinum TaxID=453220 RepID=UPI001963D336|nr:DUF523 domain-containing protein [Desulfogranum marinum]MBM9511713.1 DUF523 domain-containing protein [Desulfogranum marinum]